MKTWENETHPVPGPEITTKTLIVLKMISVIDKCVDSEDDKIDSINKLLELNHKLNSKKKEKPSISRLKIKIMRKRNERRS